MEARESPTFTPNKANSPTPKAIIYQKYGSEASYTIEEVLEPPQSGCPGLAIPQKGISLYRCILQLPNLSITSGIFRKKKDAEQSAAEMAMEKMVTDGKLIQSPKSFSFILAQLGIHTKRKDPTVEEAWDELCDRLKYLFSEKFLSCVYQQSLPSFHPLVGHFGAALKRQGQFCCLIPLCVIAVYDNKITTLSKFIDSKVESNPLLVISFVMRACKRLTESLVISEHQLSVLRKNPYPPDIIESLDTQLSTSSEKCLVEVLYIPCSLEKPLQTLPLDLSSSQYYLDIIAWQLGLSDAGKVFISRPIGKTSSETRLYFAAQHPSLFDLDSDLSFSNATLHSKGLVNTRACYLCGQHVYGDAIMASIGYTWKFKELFHEDVSLQSYYRILISKTPVGVYKLSREAILTAELPLMYTTRTNWRGSFPRDILCAFCRQQQLCEPIFSTISIMSSSSTFSATKKSNNIDHAGMELEKTDNVGKIVESGVFRCEVKIYSKNQNLVLECLPRETFKKLNDSIQNVSLKVLLWFNTYLKDPDMPIERLNSSVDALNIQFYPKHFCEEKSLCRDVYYDSCSKAHGSLFVKSNCVAFLHLPRNGDCPLKVLGPDSGFFPSIGSFSKITFSVSLVIQGEQTREPIESCDEFEFEIGSGAVIDNLEGAVMQISTGQSACFTIELPSQELILASAQNPAQILSLLNAKPCHLDYFVTLLQVTEPLEDRMEQALFNPPLSKQRVEFAVKHIKESYATTLIDFGCGSGSLLDSILNYKTTLEKIVGVDISQKSLSRAAKTLHSKLSKGSDSDVSCSGLKSLVLYDGSITEFDPRMCGFDIGTCLEVIEHMEEDEAHRFGDVVLSYFCPKILVISTPNYEYNVILQRSNFPDNEEERSDKIEAQSYKFRNHDHKFEWTRAQFNCWATELAERHRYSVEFSGVGGSADLEPGFASQIAVFRREKEEEKRESFENESESSKANRVIWEWSKSR